MKLLDLLLKEIKIPKANKGGDCFVINGRTFLNDFSNKQNTYLVHGEVAGQGPLSGITFGHCWIEDNSNVYDFSNGRELVIPKQLYYMIGNIDKINNIYKYDNKEFLNKLNEFKTWGPWDLKTKY
jgi:hypothetical protein